MHYQVKDLPEVLQSSLKVIGYHKVDIQIETSDTFTPSIAYRDNYRTMTVAVDLSSGESVTTVGDYGGGLGFTAQDVAAQSGSKVAIPVGVVFLDVQSGPTVFVNCYASPATFALVLPKEEVTLTFEEACVLYAHKAYKSSYRDRYYGENGLTCVWAVVGVLSSRGLLKVNKAGSSQITTEGKNAIAKYPYGPRK